MKKQMRTWQPDTAQRSSHLGQGQVRLFWGAAIRLRDITEGEGHVLKGEVAMKWWEKEKNKYNVTLVIAYY